MSSLGFTSKEQRNLGLLVHLMTTNPKILYSPIGSQADRVIQKASRRCSFHPGATPAPHHTHLLITIFCESVFVCVCEPVCVGLRQTRPLRLWAT